MSREKLDIIELLRSESEFVREYMARLLNAFASLNKGNLIFQRNEDVYLKNLKSNYFFTQLCICTSHAQVHIFFAMY